MARELQARFRPRAWVARTGQKFVSHGPGVYLYIDLAREPERRVRILAMLRGGRWFLDLAPVIVAGTDMADIVDEAGLMIEKGK